MSATTVSCNIYTGTTEKVPSTQILNPDYSNNNKANITNNKIFLVHVGIIIG